MKSRRNPFPCGNLRRRKTSTNPIYVCGVWLDEANKRAFDQVRWLEQQMFPDGAHHDDALVLSCMVSREIERSLERLRKQLEWRSEGFRRRAHAWFRRGAA